nr:MAG TPA: hypothetical protein [Caudoviricetes sp.]
MFKLFWSYFIGFARFGSNCFIRSFFLSIL